MTNGDLLARVKDAVETATPMCEEGAHRHELKKLLQEQDATKGLTDDKVRLSHWRRVVATTMCEREGHTGMS